VFSGVVRQTNGVPIPEAWVVLGRGRPDDVGLRTTAEGTFELTHFYSTELTVRIEKEGFLTLRREAGLNEWRARNCPGRSRGRTCR
jgi:hypothetical protein